ncbi:hypothetical protein KI387_008885, partial [Taxus chinensis]
ACNSDKNTPLHEAVKKGNQFGERALIIALQHCHVDATRLLLAATSLFLIFWLRVDRQTCLNAAAHGGHLEVVKLILNEKPSCLNMIHLILLGGDVNGVTPLYAAVHGGHLEIVREILNTPLNWFCGMNGFDKSLMTKTDDLGRCAIHITTIKGYGNIVDLFISMMPDCVEIRSSCLKTAMYFAVEYNQIGIVKRLVYENEDEITAKLVSCDFDLGGNTALHMAAMNIVDLELLVYLLSFPNVNLHAINNKGLSPLDIAVEAASQNTSDFGEIVRIFEGVDATRSLIRHSKPWKHSQQNNSKDNGSVQDDKILDVDTLVASLIATVTFVAIFQVLGGTNESNDIKNHIGVARMSLETIFQVFLFSDCLAFFASMTVVIAWLFRERLQTRIITNQSPLAKFSMLSLGTSIISTGLAFLSATILVTVPHNFEEVYKSDPKDLKEYRLMFTSEILIAYAAPLLAVVFLSLAW